MSDHENRLDRRRRLMEQAHQQRIELGHAFQGLAKPLQYTQTTIVGLQALKQYAWLIALAPTTVKLGFSLFGWKKNEQAKGVLNLFRKGGKKEAEKAAEREATLAKKGLSRYLHHGWSLFQLYRKVRPFFP